MIGRVLERKSLIRAVESDESQFVAVYGRRRIGKTYLVRETLGKMFCFEQLLSLGAALCLAGCSTVAISEKGSLAGVDVKGADGRADRTLCVGNEGAWLFNSLPILSSSMDWSARKNGIDPYDLSLFKNETSVQRLTEAFYRYAERENCDVVDVVVDNRTTHPIGLFGISEWVGDIISTREVYITGVLKERK